MKRKVTRRSKKSVLVSPDSVHQLTPPVAPAEPPTEPGILDKILASLRGIEGATVRLAEAAEKAAVPGPKAPRKTKAAEPAPEVPAADDEVPPKAEPVLACCGARVAAGIHMSICPTLKKVVSYEELRAAAVAFAGKHTKAAMVELVQQYAPDGKLFSVSEEQRAELLKKLGA